MECGDIDLQLNIKEADRQALIRNSLITKCGRIKRFILRFKRGRSRAIGIDVGIKYKRWFGKVVVTDVVFFPPLHPNCGCVIVPEGVGE